LMRASLPSMYACVGEQMPVTELYVHEGAKVLLVNETLKAQVWLDSDMR
jgi:hypothetical protein